MPCLVSSVELRVADTGQGIAGRFLPHVFERFRQADGGTTRVHGGLGLGLSLVRQLVELHGGTVTAQSDGEGRGATFTMSLPLAAARPFPPSTPLPSSDGDLQGELAGLRPLVVDDDQDTREMLALLHGSQGAEVQEAASASEGMQRLRDERPDVVVSDIGMPGEDGDGFLRAVRALPEEAGGRVLDVALSAHARGEDRRRALHAGFHHHVAKPVDPRELLAVLTSLVRSRKPLPHAHGAPEGERP